MDFFKTVPNKIECGFGCSLGTAAITMLSNDDLLPFGDDGVQSVAQLMIIIEQFCLTLEAREVQCSLLVLKIFWEKAKSAHKGRRDI